MDNLVLRKKEKISYYLYPLSKYFNGNNQWNISLIDIKMVTNALQNDNENNWNYLMIPQLKTQLVENFASPPLPHTTKDRENEKTDIKAAQARLTISMFIMSPISMNMKVH